MMDMIPIPPETDDQRADRLEREIVASIGNNTLLRRVIPQVYRNNERLRSGIRDLLAALPDDRDLSTLVGKLQSALAIPFAYERPPPDDAIPDEAPLPESLTDRVAILQTRLGTLGRINYRIQEAAAPVAWNSDAIRKILRQTVRELVPATDGRDVLPTTLDDALIASIVDDIEATMKAAADK